MDEDVARLGQQLVRRGQMMATAESCTGGLIAARCTDIAGSSRWLERGFVTYSNAAKTGLLGVPPSVIEAHGAVSEAVVRAMVAGAIARSHAAVAVSVSGVAGPDGGSASKPVGTVWVGYLVTVPGGSAVTVDTECVQLPGDRAAVRAAAASVAIHGLLDRTRNTG
ncbi:MAG: CinA family protein [Pseudomonadota bacterium]